MTPQRTVLFLAPPGDPRGPAAAAAFAAAVGRMGLNWSAECRDPSYPEWAAFHRVVSFVPDLAPAEYWGPGEVAAKVMGLIATMLGGKAAGPPDPPPPPPPKKTGTAKVGRETAGRRGKGVTTIFDLNLSESEMATLAAVLKNACGTGGTVKDGRIEIQGDQRDRVVAELEKRGYKVKRAGG